MFQEITEEAGPRANQRKRGQEIIELKPKFRKNSQNQAFPPKCTYFLVFLDLMRKNCRPEWAKNHGTDFPKSLE